jgi:hypothetical protein
MDKLRVLGAFAVQPLGRFMRCSAVELLNIRRGGSCTSPSAIELFSFANNASKIPKIKNGAMLAPRS